MIIIFNQITKKRKNEQIEDNKTVSVNFLGFFPIIKKTTTKYHKKNYLLMHRLDPKCLRKMGAGYAGKIV